MEPSVCKQIIKKRALAKAALSRVQTFIESGEHKVHQIEVRFEELPRIFNKFDTVQKELELQDDMDHSDDRNQFEAQYFEVKARCNELLHPVVEPLESKQASPTSSESKKSNQTRRSHTSSSNIK
jgi:hypothetical protein